MTHTKFTKTLILIGLISFATGAYAQEVPDSAAVNWQQYAANKNLTFLQIITTCDSLFALPGNSDSDTGAEAENDSYTNYNRWKQFWMPRLDAATGKLHNLAATALSSLSGSGGYSDCNETSVLQASIASTITGGAGWKYLGPQGVSTSTQILGRATAISVNTVNPNEVYIANDWGGLWKSTNALSGSPAWVCLTDNNTTIAGMGVTHFVVDYNYTPHHIFLSLGFPAYFNYFYETGTTAGLWCSADDGATFYQKPFTSIADFSSDAINDIKLWPGNVAFSADNEYLFMTTQYKLLQLNISNLAGTLTTATDAVVTDFLAPLSADFAGAPSRFQGLNGCNFIPDDLYNIYFSTNSNNGNADNISARLYTSALFGYSVTVTPTDLTNSLYLPSSQVTSTSGANWNFDPGWEYNSTAVAFEYTPTTTSACLANSAMNESYLSATTYTVSFTLTVPVNTYVNVYMADYSSSGNCGDLSLPTVPVAAYTASGTYYPTYTVTATNVGQLVFSAALGSSSVSPSSPVIVSNVSVNQVYFNYIYNLASSAADPDNLYLIAGPVQKINSNNDGSGWTYKNLPANDAIFTLSQSAPDILYSGNQTGLATIPPNYINFSSGAAYIPINQYETGGHADHRSLFAVTCNTCSPTADYLFVGCDGGLGLMNNLYAITTTSVSGTWQNLNGSGFSCSFSWDIGTSIHNGEVALGVADNGIDTSNQLHIQTWSNLLNAGGDGGYSQFGKRYATRNTLFAGGSYDGGSRNVTPVNISAVNPIFTYPPNLNFNNLNICLSKLKTTYNNEYVCDNVKSSPCNIYDVAVTATGSSSYTGVWNSITSTPNPPVAGTTPTPNPGWPAYSLGNYIQAIAPDMYDPDFVAAYVTTSFWEPGIFMISTNANSVTPTWTQFPNNSAPTNGEFIVDMCADPGSSSSNKRMWACASWYRSPGYHRVFEGVYTGGTLTWTDYSDGLPACPVNAIVYDEQSNYLFAGTDMGVYARYADNSDSIWECYTLNLPNSFINALDINRCTGKISASCVGRGGYQADLPPISPTVSITDACNYDYISASTTWAQDVDEMRSIYIPAGVTLTIQNCTVNMGRNKSIIVAAGGHLIVNNAVITNGCAQCFWQGIQLNGSDYLQQTAANDGWATIENNSVIANALVGVTNYNSSGGIVQAVNSSFIDNNNDVTLANYTNTNSFGTLLSNNSYFCNCNFLLDNNYKGDAMNFPAAYFVSLESVSGVSFQGCRWLNRDTFALDSLRGYGLFANSAGFSVSSWCPDELYYLDCPDLVPSRFCGFTNGINVQNTFGADFTISVATATFDSSGIGVNVSAQNNVACTADTFNVGNGIGVIAINGFCPQNIGLYLQNTTIFKDEGNVFTGNPSGAAATVPNWQNIGTIVANSDPALVFIMDPQPLPVNTIYRNIFTGLTEGAYALGMNNGLSILCNNFSYNTTDIYSCADAAAWQGIDPIQGGFVQPAGNTFSNSVNNIVNNTGNAIFYYYNSTDPAQYPPVVSPAAGSNAVSLASTTATASCTPTYGVIQPNNIPYPLAPVRLSQPTLQSYEQSFLTEQQSWQDSVTAENTRLDFGNTDSLVGFIDTVTCTGALYRTLIAGAPWLSAHAAWAAAGRQSSAPANVYTPMLSDSLMVSVLEQNPDLLRNGYLMNFVDSIYTFNPLQAARLQVFALNSATARTITDDSISSAGTEMGNYANQIIMDLAAPGDTDLDSSTTNVGVPAICTDSTSIYYLLDSNSVYCNLDSLDAWLRHIGGLWTYYARAGYYNQLQQYTIADSIFNNIPSALIPSGNGGPATQATMSNIWSVLYNAETAGRDIYGLDSADIAALDTTSVPVATANTAEMEIVNITNIILPTLSHFIALPCGVDQLRHKAPGNSGSSSIANMMPFTAPAGAGSRQFSAYPNPASGAVTFTYNVPGAGGNVRIVITNVVGEQEAELNTGNNTGAIQWSPVSLPPGIYIYQATAANGIITTGKIVLSR